MPCCRKPGESGSKWRNRMTNQMKIILWWEVGIGLDIKVSENNRYWSKQGPRGEEKKGREGGRRLRKRNVGGGDP